MSIGSRVSCEKNTSAHIFWVLFFIFLPISANAQEWKEEKGDHFIIFYMHDAVKPRDILHKAEQYYGRIAEDIGYPRYSNFWQWDKRAKIYVHPDKASFQEMTGQPTWSDGMASYHDKTIHTIEGTKGFLDLVLPHEITHLIFRDFVGFSGQTPLWLDEGIAQWEEVSKRKAALERMPGLLSKGEVFTVRQITAMDIRSEKDTMKVHQFYLQAISLVDFLVHRFGALRFTQFCRELRDGADFETALTKGFQPYIQNMDDFESQWRKYVYGQAAPVPAESATGPLRS